MRIAHFAFAILSASVAPRLHSETLADVLATHKLSANLLPKSEGERHITSFAVSADNRPFLLAYYDDDGSGTLPALLHVLRYDIKRGKLRSVDLRGKETQTASAPKLPHAVSENCLGSALSISEHSGFIFIDTHITPSAGCVLVLHSDLTYSNELYGWVLANMGTDILVEGSMIHFASTHPAKLFLYEPRRKRSLPVYPLSSDVARQRFSAELQKLLPTNDWCAENNNPCDPENFTTDIENIQSDERERSFSYDAQMSSEGFGENAEASIESKTIHYKWWWEKGTWRQVSP